MARKKGETKLSDIEKFCLYGYLATGNIDMAWKLSRPSPPTASVESTHVLALRWVRKPTVKAFISDAQKLQFKSAKEKQTGNRSKDDIIRELNVLITQSEGQTKLQADLIKLLAQLEGMAERKTEEDLKEERTVFYLPYVSKCNSCELMKLYRKIKADQKEH